jgi:hypothetical protein
MMKYFHECYSATDLEKLRSAMDEELRELFDSNRILTISWVDYSTYLKVLLTADKILGSGDFEILKQANYFSARNDLHGIYQVLVSLISPKTAIGALSRLMNKYYDHGKLTVVDLKEDSATIRIEGAPDIPRFHDIDQGAYVEEVLRMAGANNVEWKHPKCMARGDAFCLAELTWC